MAEEAQKVNLCGKDLIFAAGLLIEVVTDENPHWYIRFKSSNSQSFRVEAARGGDRLRP
mgnify:CR=1 FL=1